MGNKIIYQKNELVGPWGCKYLEERPHKKNRGRRALFQCGFCNQTFESEIGHVKRGSTRSCGCQNQNRKYNNLTNKRFGKLIAIKPTDKRQSKSIVWLCKCDCGNYTEVLQFNLTKGYTTSCGCKNTSKGEDIIEKILQQKNIKYQTQYIFKDCVNLKTKRHLRFDFYLSEYNCCIEYDGIQHFQETDMCSDTLDERQYRDNLKNQYCKEKGIKLIRIPYWDYDKIDINYLLNKIEN